MLPNMANSKPFIPYILGCIFSHCNSLWISNVENETYFTLDVLDVSNVSIFNCSLNLQSEK